jgi:8-oxo-dGTP diphosphatase
MSKIPFPSGIKRVAVFCILKAGEYYLLLQRAKSPNAGKYVPVGGKIDAHETPFDAVIRETYEETGIQLTTVEYFGTLVETSPTDYNWMSFIYKADIDYCDPPICDEGILEWIHISQLKDLDTPPTDWHIYQYIAAGRKFALDATFDKDLNMTTMTEMISGDIVL